MIIQQGEGNTPLVLVIRYPDALPSVPSKYKELAYAELMRVSGVAYMQILANFNEHYTDPGRATYQVTAKLKVKKRKEELEVFVLSSRQVEADIVEDWVRRLLIKQLTACLQPDREGLLHLEFQRLQDIAEKSGIAPDSLDEQELEPVHQDYWSELCEIDFVWPPPRTTPTSEPDETTYEHVFDPVEDGIREEIRQRIDLVA